MKKTRKENNVFLADNLVIGKILTNIDANCFGLVQDISNDFHLFVVSGSRYIELFTGDEYGIGMTPDYYNNSKSGIIQSAKYISYFPSDVGKYLDKDKLLEKMICLNSNNDKKENPSRFKGSQLIKKIRNRHKNNIQTRRV